ncbi:hypothetical protein M2137_002810 [Parabacteroides sp. PFB2-10]|uniref:hypothetical protein n=1 Tax=Parabacteroides sp. PFB2-10 TaxID=1742405 RepID=UPI0024744E5F|nr:hypothetical protein [Parabacteroides sp. PFB2-10]MDH6314017.1 hypothetical protein [Parabacteroides sp. PFB2-10]MDL2244638.1 hypothetical protein [Parabacteroides sp. OttesenSCG-928-J18]
MQFEKGLYFEDLMFTPLALRQAHTIGYIDKVLYFYRDNPNSITNTFSKKQCVDFYYAARKLYGDQQIYATREDKWFPFFQRYIDGALSCFFNNSIKISRSARREAYNLLKQDKELLQAQSKSMGRNIKSFLLCHAKAILPLYIVFEDSVIMPLKRK